MYNYQLHQLVNRALRKNDISLAGRDNLFCTRLISNAAHIQELFSELYGKHAESSLAFEQLIQSLVDGHLERSETLQLSDEEKEAKGHWYLSNEIVGMSLYTDRFCGNLQELAKKLPYFTELGVNLLHLMPLFESPEQESDGGYAVSDFKKVDSKVGTTADLVDLQHKMGISSMYLMIDIVINHTSRQHDWAKRAACGESRFQDYYYMYEDLTIPDEMEKTMPEIFPESSPGNFTYEEKCRKWVMTVFHSYQWDLNYRNPWVFIAMLENMIYYGNLGVDILRVDAPAFIWKQMGTSCQNLPSAHSLLRLFKLCLQVAAPGVALLAEAIVSPSAILKYFGTGIYMARECDFAYNATQMALQWDALATGDTRVMMAAQHELLQKPYGTSWITYTRCHDDIGLGYDDYMIRQAGFDPFAHRNFLREFYSGQFPGSTARGALFSVNHNTQDARISGSLASLCGLEAAREQNNSPALEIAIRKILLMQAHSFFIGGVPMLYYGDELGYANDYSYLQDPGKSYDNRWMHRPLMDWHRNRARIFKGTVEERIFSGTRKLIRIRKSLEVVGDFKNLTWLSTHNIHVAAFMRTLGERSIYCLFNFCTDHAYLTWHLFKEHGAAPVKLYNYWDETHYEIGDDYQHLVMEPYSFMILEPA